MIKLEKSQINYYVFPSVVKKNEESIIRIIPRNAAGRLDISFNFRFWNSEKFLAKYPQEWLQLNKDAHCEVTIIPLCSWYDLQSTDNCDKFDIKVDEDGGLTIKYKFTKEQEYLIQVANPMHKDYIIYSFSLYCLEDDLYNLTPFKGDLHIHSFYSDANDSLETIACDYRANGFDFIALTDHFKRFPSVYLKELIDDHKFGLTVYNGEEVHVPDAKIHYVHVGGSYSVNERFSDNKEKYYKEYQEIYNSLDFEDEEFKDFIARTTWIHEANKDAGGLSIFAHPHWRWKVQNIPHEVSDYIFEHGLMDAFEILGGQSASENNTQVTLYYKHALQGKKYPFVASSDAHTTSLGGEFNSIYSIVFAENCNFENIKKLY